MPSDALSAFPIGRCYADFNVQCSHMRVFFWHLTYQHAAVIYTPSEANWTSTSHGVSLFFSSAAYTAIDQFPVGNEEQTGVLEAFANVSYHIKILSIKNATWCLSRLLLPKTITTNAILIICMCKKIWFCWLQSLLPIKHSLLTIVCYIMTKRTRRHCNEVVIPYKRHLDARPIWKSHQWTFTVCLVCRIYEIMCTFWCQPSKPATQLANLFVLT